MHLTAISRLTFEAEFVFKCKGAQQSPPPTFRPMSIVAKRSPSSDTAELLLSLCYLMLSNTIKWYVAQTSEPYRPNVCRPNGCCLNIRTPSKHFHTIRHDDTQSDVDFVERIMLKK